MILKVVFGVYLSLIFVACGKEEITPSIEFPHLYDIQDNPLNPVQHKRFELYTTYHVPVYFNDTIARNFVRINHQGDSVFQVETLDISWEYTSQDKNTQYKYVYLTDETEQLNALEVVHQYLAGLSVPLRPFSVFVAQSAVKETNGSESRVKNQVGYRVVLITGIEHMNESEAGKLALQLKKDMIANKIMNYTDEMAAFNKISKDWYNTVWTNLEGVPEDFSSSQVLLWGSLDEEDLAEIRAVVGKFGFVGGQNDDVISWIGGGRKSPESKDTDLSMYLDEMLKYSKADFKLRWGHAPFVMEKYEILYQIIADKLEVEL